MILEQSVRQEQRMQLSQKQTLSLQVLAMNNSELDSYVQVQQLENPILEVHKESRSYDELTAVGQWFRSTKTYDRTGAFEDEEEFRKERSYSDVEPLRSHILGQLPLGEYESRDLRLMEFLIDSLDSRGYLPLTAEQTALLTGVSEEKAQEAISRLQSMEPIGLGAHDLIECLELQARARGAEPEVYTLIENYLEDIGECRYHRISKDLGISVKKIKECVLFIKSLNPIPINGFSRGDVEYIHPDVIFSWQPGEGWQVEINDGWIGSIGVSALYIQMSKEVDDPEIKKYFAQKIDAANFVVHCVEQRRSTLEKVSRFLLEYQSDFFSATGPLKRLTLRQIAEALSFHESTVSRALKDKYVASPRGTFLLKNCLMGGITTADGEKEISRSEILDKLQELIRSEDRAKPYSDSTLAVLLEEAGMPISRRTVTKYREELHIPNAFARRY